MVKPSTAGMKNGLRYPHGISGTLTPRQWSDFLAYVEQRRQEERVERFMQTDALRELVIFALDAKLHASNTTPMSRRGEAA